VAAKTGYIRGVSCLSGYVLDKASRPAIAFSMLVNDMPGRIATAKDLQDELCAVLIDASDGR
jgi:D-alanyl-D-alanine carboxypeptidase